MRRFIFGLATWLWATAAVANVPCTLPFNLQNNTVADATQVMANYNALVTCLTNAAAAGANSDITALLGLTTPLSYTVGGSSVYVGGTSGGSANAQTVASPTPLGFSLLAGKRITAIAGFTNTSATTLNVNTTGVTAVNKMTPAGLAALTGGEIIAGVTFEAEYDGTVYVLFTKPAENGGYGPLTSIASATTTDLGTIPSHYVNVTGATTITGLGSTAVTTYPHYRLKFAGALLLTYNASSLIIPGAANITTAANDTATALYLGSGNWQITTYSKASGNAVVSPNPIQGGFKNLSIKVASNTTVTVAADYVTMFDGTASYRTVAISGTTDLGSNGACNKLDTGTIAVNTWYAMWAISNGSTDCTLASTSFTAPTMPSGYTYSARIGAVQTINASATLYGTWQFGRTAQYKVGLAQTTVALLVMANGVTGTYSQTSPTLANVAVGRFVPPTASRISVNAFSAYHSGAGSNVLIAPSTSWGGTNMGPAGSTGGPWPLFASSSTAGGPSSVTLTLESTNIAAAMDAAGGAIGVLGWEDNI